ncbi:enoyl-CoA hydratase/isomerase family protein [Xanthovirga aplysinae]|uniref:enoyl-CoA hydratase/isomerase family protein n=1 Tax=Xanthovirga aplysinae TaxID=2529853 RepID=UPI0012BCD7FB|nr:enoyl-CoA hydratase/isomerase family protein [Xanthovirga aplysinae]MTI33564.1 enoyl-CoA hydratase/isomerase family protein [Xanthovirga aplysinae]
MKFVNYELKDRVASITLNRADKRNAINQDMINDLMQALTKAEENSECKVVIIKANGKTFSAGADLAELQRMQTNNYDENLEDSSHLRSLFYKIYTLEKVVIAQVQGHAIAGGCGLVSVCDFAFSVTEAMFGYSEVRIGFVPAIVSVFLIRKLGEQKAKELLLTGELISAEKAVDLGLIYKVVEANELEDHVNDFAQHLCIHNSGQSMALTKKMIAEVQSMDFLEALEYSSKMNARSRSNEDCKRGIATFLKKESMVW